MLKNIRVILNDGTIEVKYHFESLQVQIIPYKDTPPVNAFELKIVEYFSERR